MKDLLKKHDDELPAVHPPHHEVDRMARARVVPGMDGLPADVDALAARLRASSAAGRTNLIAAIHSRFGNAFVGRVIAASRSGRRGAPAGGGTPGTGRS